ncbi:DegT/DnrJ/EryC1/StrS family aminotransferase [Halocynthiibacter namhaensis]|uniref:DegT/DnrJ/EryC1/StrS family aminotransferase n=1 Tax=Halocynthiibacter namhaensis TaxID=1290553 RepID=UPI0005791403|nr:DegT/DnrJ/EryC1/StrS family aminotransferase [Halocynthiibacter namhaensis]
MPGFEWIGEEERAALNALMDEGGVFFAHGFTSMRKAYHVRELEAQFCEHMDLGNALCVSSGTAAIKVALKAMGVKAGDEVITQCFNFVAGLEAIVDCGATPVIAGSDATLNMDPAQLEGLITPKTTCIMPVHMLGVPAKMDEINAIAKAHGIPVLEDACEAVGAKYKGQFVGAVGDFGVFSLDYGKMITTGEGGLVIAKGQDDADTARHYHDHGHMNLPDRPRGRDRAAMPGYNCRMSELNAVVGKVQLSKLDRIWEETKKRYMALEKGLSDVLDGRAYPRDIPEGAEPTHDTFIFGTKDDDLRQAVIDHLTQTGFGTKNLPDAMEWHCSFYWEQFDFDIKTQAAVDTQALLLEQIAIPVMLGIEISAYEQLGQELAALIRK